jgi:hypothetical protein
VAVGVVLLVVCWRRASFGLAVAAALALSPIVWLDYFAVAAVPLAVVRPRLSAVWFAPLATWGPPITGVEVGNGWDSLRVLSVFAVVFAVIVLAEGDEAIRDDIADGTSHPSPAAEGGWTSVQSDRSVAERP